MSVAIFTRSAWLVALLGGVALLLPAGCDSCRGDDGAGRAPGAVSAAPSGDIPLSRALTEAERSRAAGLAGQVRRGRFPKAVVKHKDNASLFLHLAATSHQPETIAASLDAMRASFAAINSKRGRPRADDDYGLVVATHLESDQPSVQEAAIRASSNVIQGRTPYRPVIDGLLAIVDSHPTAGARVEALEALQHVDALHRSAAVVSALLRALEHDSAAVLSTALGITLRAAQDDLLRKEDFVTRARALLRHRDPGVRARAVRVLGRLGSGSDEVVAELSRLLGDEHPLVRSRAALALGDLGAIRTIHRIVPLAGDLAVESYSIPYRSLSGRRKNIRHGKRGKTVHDRVVVLLEEMTAKTKWPFKRTPRKKNNRAASRRADTAAVQAWYAKHRAELPKDDAPPAPHQGDARGS